MSTHATVAVKINDTAFEVYRNKYRTIHIHFDGGPTSLGDKLLRRFPDYMAALKLVQYGDLNSISDLHQAEVLAREFNPRDLTTRKEVLKESEPAAYLYVFINHTWYFLDNYARQRGVKDGNILQNLEDFLKLT
jgi:hypothetical protein